MQEGLTLGSTPLHCLEQWISASWHGFLVEKLQRKACACTWQIIYSIADQYTYAYPKSKCCCRITDNASSTSPKYRDLHRDGTFVGLAV
jgi:hypothetical protein